VTVDMDWFLIIEPCRPGCKKINMYVFVESISSVHLRLQAFDLTPVFVDWMGAEALIASLEASSLIFEVDLSEISLVNPVAPREIPPGSLLVGKWPTITQITTDEYYYTLASWDYEAWTVPLPLQGLIGGSEGCIYAVWEYIVGDLPLLPAWRYPNEHSQGKLSDDTPTYMSTTPYGYKPDVLYASDTYVSSEHPELDSYAQASIRLPYLMYHQADGPLDLSGWNIEIGDGEGIRKVKVYGLGGIGMIDYLGQNIFNVSPAYSELFATHSGFTNPPDSYYRIELDRGDVTRKNVSLGKPRTDGNGKRNKPRFVLPGQTLIEVLLNVPTALGHLPEEVIL